MKLTTAPSSSRPAKKFSELELRIERFTRDARLHRSPSGNRREQGHIVSGREGLAVVHHQLVDAGPHTR